MRYWQENVLHTCYNFIEVWLYICVDKLKIYYMCTHIPEVLLVFLARDSVVSFGSRLAPLPL